MFHVMVQKVDVFKAWWGCLFLSYKLRIESMLLKEEFAANMGYLEPSINAMILAGEGKKTPAAPQGYFTVLQLSAGYSHYLLFTDLMTNKHLQEVLYMIVVAGNFLNSVGVW
ncbi:hypothetical protein PR048_004552 [Dryococelus australis]|uniref:Uncharacterized protein n=1 Tax=Dryococelus australis TaxID=614101 RepID=A0ABQ9I5R2_9NEOP|nr:hypothetical protein PR048_004552 [Dryococelus australis]